MKCYKDRLLETPILQLYALIAKQKTDIDIAKRDLGTMQDALRERTCGIAELLAETERLYDEGDKSLEWANTFGFLGCWPKSKHYRKPPAGRSDLEITHAMACNEYEKALNIERRQQA